MLRDTIKMNIFTDSNIEDILDKSETEHLKKFTKIYSWVKMSLFRRDTLQTLCRFSLPLKFILVSFPP